MTADFRRSPNMLNNTVSAIRKPAGLQKRSLVWTRTCTPPETGSWQGKPSRALHTLNMTYVNFSSLAGAAGHCVPKQAEKADA